MSAISIRGLSKKYPIYQRPLDRLKEMLSRGRRRYHEEFWALKALDMEVPRGSTIGVIGHNGSGKSTLLQIVAGVLQPTAGELQVNGRVSALLELGAGFNPEFTGRENVFMSGAVMGLTRREMEQRLDTILTFAEIGNFIDQPVKTYSSGMYVRLAFAVAINVDPDILLVDEALSVGDAVFQHRCMRKIRELKDRGVTIFFVSHDTGAVRSLCDYAYLLDHGRIVRHGVPEDVVNHYHALVAKETSQGAYSETAVVAEDQISKSIEEAETTAEAVRAFDERVNLFRHGTGDARIIDVELLDLSGAPLPVVEFNQEVCFRATFDFKVPVESSVIGFIVRDRLGNDILGTNSYEEGRPLPVATAGDRMVVDFKLALPIKPGDYSLTVAVAYNPRDIVYMDWVDNALVFTVLPPQHKIVHGMAWVPTDINVSVKGRDLSGNRK